MSFIKKQSLHQRKIGDNSLILTADGNIEINLKPGKNVSINANLIATGDVSGPKVSNVYYVTEDGSDTNNGRSADKYGAFATIKKAAEVAPEGSTIIVAPGDYYEENPITLRDFVTVTGQGELRNTRIFPRNDQQTIFYVGNGCYLYQLTFRALRAPGWCAEIRPGTLCTTSPYVQNCTNMNGPWLNDGTEFIPFETVQIEGIEPGARPLLVEDYPELPLAKQINDYGGGGGILVDGDKYDPASLVFSFVADAFTQIAQGGIGFHITNFGYTQIVSCFTVFTSTGFLTTAGGYLSISNSVSDFGINGCIADGYYPIAYTNAVPAQNYYSSVGSVTIQNPGSGYTSAPSVIFEPPTGPGGVTATGIAQVDLTTGQIAAVSILTNGSGYEQVPQITFTGGGATIQAEGTVNLTTNSVIRLGSLRDKPQTGSVIQFQGNPTFYYIVGNEIIDPPFTYDEQVCRRDVRRIIDAVTGDIVLGTNYQSVAAATSYLRSTASKVILDQLAPTIYGLEAARDEMKAATSNLAMREEIDQRFNIITSVLSAGDSTGTPDLIYNDLSTIDSGIINAKDNIRVNRDFIISELTYYINDQFTELSYNQAQYRIDMDNLIRGIAMYVAIGSDQQVIRQAQEFETRPRFKNMLVSSFHFLKQKFLALPSVAASGVGVANVTEGFNQFINIIDDGDSAGITIEFPSHTGAETNKVDAKDQLQANKDFLKEEFVAFIADENPVFYATIDPNAYKQDIEYLVDALSFDILYGGTSSTIQEAIYYFNNRNISGLNNTERTVISDAFARLRFVMQRVVRGLSVTPTLGNPESQDFSSGTATSVEATLVDSLVQYFETVVDNNSVSGLPSKTYPIFTSEPVLQQNAANSILAQRVNYIEDAVDYNLANNPTLTYDTEKCARDVGYIIDAIYRDAQLGTNHNSITAALAYSRANTAYLNVEQKPATIIALRYAKTLLVEAANRDTIFQTSVSNLFDDIINIIEFDQLPSEGTVYEEPGPASTELINAFNQLVDNRAFLVAETIAYINDNNFVYDQAKCERDTGLILDAAYFDAALGTNYNAVTAGLAYQRANSAYVLSAQNIETVGAITYARGEAETATSGDATAQSRVTAAFNEIIDIIQNGVVSTDTAADALVFPNPSTSTVAQQNAKSQIQNNRNFLAAEAVAYIQNNYENFVYDQAKCERDVELIMDAVALDVALGTNYNAVTAGLAYQRASSADLQDNQKIQTVAALQELKKQIVLLGLSDLAQPRAEAAMDEIIDILENGVLSTDTSADALVFPTPGTLPSINAVEAKDRLIANKSFIIAEIISWVNTNYPALSYDSTKCARDVGYIVDALCHDILYGGNSATIQAAQSYFVGVVSQLGAGEEAATAAAYNRLGQVVGDVVINAPVVKTGVYPETQNTGGSPASSTEVDDLSGLVKIIEDVILAGTTSGLPATLLPSVLWTSSDLQQAYNVIKGNKTPVKTLIINFITENFQSFTFNSTKCERDTKYIVDALTYDIIYGGNSATVQAAQSYYVGATSQVAGQQIQTADALAWVSTIIEDVILDVAVADPEQIVVTQDSSAGAGSASEVTVAQNLLQIFQDVIINGVDNLPTVVYPDITWATAGIQAAVGNLAEQKETIIDDTITYIGTTYNGFSYDEAKCARDTGYLIDAVAHDLLYTGNIATLIATRAYFLGAVQYIPAYQVANTVDAYQHLASVVEDCIEGVAVTPTTGNTESQVLSGNYGTSVESTASTALFNITINAIDNGTLIGTPSEVEPNFAWLADSTKTAATVMLSQKAIIQDAVIDFITENIIGFEYNIAKCERDTGYIIDAALYDLMYGGNKQTRRAALAYYNGAILGAAKVGNADQVLVTAYSYYKLGDILSSVAKNDLITKSYANPLNQDVGIPDGSAAAANTLELLVDRIALSVLEGNTNNWTEIDHDYTLGSTIYKTERDAIVGQTETIVETSIADLNATFGGTADITLFPGIISVETTQQGNLYNVSTISTSGHAFEYVGAGVTYNALPFFGGTAVPAQEIQELNQGKVFAGGTVDQIGNFRVGNFFAVNALTGAITLNANQIDLSGLTSVGPFIRDGIPVGVELKEVSDNSNLIASIGTQDFNTAPTQRAVSVYVENRYLNKLTGGTVTGNLILVGDFDVQGSVISTTETGPFSLLNTSATTIDAFGAATTINIGSSTGSTNIAHGLVVTGTTTLNNDVTINGDVSLNIPDETLQAFSISTEGSLDYVSINTRTDEERITFGIRPTILIENTTESTNKNTGAVVIDGGVGIEKNVFIGGSLQADGSVVLGDDRAIDTLDINAATDIDIPDNLGSVFRIHENITDYITIDTTDSSEVVEIGSVPNLILLNSDDATSSTTGALQATGGISTQRNFYAGVDIIADRDIIAERDLEVNGTNIITDETGAFNLLNTNATTINAFGAATAINIGAVTGLITFNNEQVIFDSVKTIQIPVGTTLDRPAPATGQIRFNTDTTVFEGYDGIAWGSLGGVKDVDQNTFIRPETSPGANNDELEFFTNGVRRLLISNTEFYLESTNDVTILNTTESFDYASGAVKIAGGVGIAKNLFVQGFISGNNSGVLQLTNLATDVVDIRANTILAQDGVKLITNAPDSAADDIIYPLTLAHHTISGIPVIGSGTGIKFELETQNDNFETGGQIDVIAQDVTGTQEDFDMVFSTMNSGSVSEKLRLSETIATLTTSLQVDQDLFVTGILDAAGFRGSIFADDSTQIVDSINNRIIVVNADIGTLTLTTDLEVQYGGTGVSSFTTDGILYGNAAGPIQVTDAAGTSDQSVSYQILTVVSDVDTTPVWTDTIDGGSF